MTTDLGMVANNVRMLSKSSSQEISAVVKENSYGGGPDVALAAIRGGAKTLSVYDLGEAEMLRQRLGPHTAVEIIVLGNLREQSKSQIAGAPLQTYFVARSEMDIKRLESIARFYDREYFVMAGINLGIGRGDPSPKTAIELLSCLRKSRYLTPIGAMGHFSSAGVRDKETKKQINRFDRTVAEMVPFFKSGPFRRCPIISLPNTMATLLDQTGSYSNVARVGWGLQGLEPYDHNRAICSLESTTKVEATIDSLFDNKRGETFGYVDSFGRLRTVARDCRIGCIRLHAWPKAALPTHGKVLLRNKSAFTEFRAPFFPEPMLSAIYIDLTDIKERVSEGTSVVLFSNGNADQLNSIPVVAHSNGVSGTRLLYDMSVRPGQKRTYKRN